MHVNRHDGKINVAIGWVGEEDDGGSTYIGRFTPTDINALIQYFKVTDTEFEGMLGRFADTYYTDVHPDDDWGTVQIMLQRVD
jgi:hypothetical protein